MPGSIAESTGRPSGIRVWRMARTNFTFQTAEPLVCSRSRQSFAISRRNASEVCRKLALQNRRGRREDRVRAAPAVSCAIAHRKRAHEHTGPAGASRPSLRSGFTAYFVLSPVNGFLATVIMRILPHHLTPAPRHQDHTTSPYASRALVLHTLCVHRISPRVRDVRTPLSSGEMGELVALICPTG